MKLEILDFYPKEKTDAGYICGDIKIRLPDLKINVLGIYVCRRTNGKWLILTPYRSVEKEGKQVRFPVVAFDDEDHKALMGELYAQVPDFIEKRLADTKNPIIFPPPKQSSPSHQKTSLSAQMQATKVKAALSLPKASSAPAKPRVFVDLPKPTTTKGKGRCIVKTI
ncbi:MAG: hypothetical protein LLG04_01320 [Parachlamydia sp.]|nr:hypothetical protein [Parachlamydia sp.]